MFRDAGPTTEAERRWGLPRRQRPLCLGGGGGGGAIKAPKAEEDHPQPPSTQNTGLTVTQTLPVSRASWVFFNLWLREMANGNLMDFKNVLKSLHFAD